MLENITKEDFQVIRQKIIIIYLEIHQIMKL